MNNTMPEVVQIDLSNFPKIGNDAIAVGFAGGTALEPLRNLLLELLNPIKKQNGKDSKNNKQYQDEMQRLVTKQQQTAAKQAWDSLTFLEKIEATLKGVSKNDANMIKQWKEDRDLRAKANAYLIRTIQNGFKTLTNALDKSLSDMNIYRELESSGVMLADGFQSLTVSAKELGMTHEDLAKRLAKMSPTIAKLNASMGNGAKIYQNAAKGLTTKYQMTADEVQSAFESVIDSKTPMQLLQMSEEQLRIEVDKQAKSMKALSLATGKSIDMIKQEQDIKSRALRVQAWQSSHKDMYNALKAAGLDSDEWIDFFASGGARTNANIAVQLAGNDFLRAMAGDIMTGVQNGTLNQNMIASSATRYKGLGIRQQQKWDRYTNIPAYMAMASAGQLPEQSLFGGRDATNAMMNMTNMNQKLTPEQEEQRERDKKRLSNLQNIFEEQNRISEAAYQMAGGINTTDINIAIGNEILTRIEKILNPFATMLAGTPFATFTGVIWNIFGGALNTFFASKLAGFFGGLFTKMITPLTSFGGWFKGLKQTLVTTGMSIISAIKQTSLSQGLWGKTLEKGFLGLTGKGARGVGGGIAGGMVGLLSGITSGNPIVAAFSGGLAGWIAGGLHGALGGLLCGIAGHYMGSLVGQVGSWIGGLFSSDSDSNETIPEVTTSSTSKTTYNNYNSGSVNYSDYQSESYINSKSFQNVLNNISSRLYDISKQLDKYHTDIMTLPQPRTNFLMS